MAKISFSRPEPGGVSQCFSDTILQFPQPRLADPPFSYHIYLCLSLRFHSPALLQTNGTKNSGKQMSLLFSWISKRGRVFRGRRVWSRVADDPGGASMWHYTTLNHSSREKASLLTFFLDLPDYIWGHRLVLVFNNTSFSRMC